MKQGKGEILTSSHDESVILRKEVVWGKKILVGVMVGVMLFAELILEYYNIRVVETEETKVFD
jgi:hypothetical protein